MMKIHVKKIFISASQVFLLLICCNQEIHASGTDSYVVNGIGTKHSEIFITKRRRRELFRKELVVSSIKRPWGFGESDAESKSMERSTEAAHQRTRQKLESTSFVNAYQGMSHYSLRYSMSFVYMPQMRPKKHKEPKDRKHNHSKKHNTTPPQPKNDDKAKSNVHSDQSEKKEKGSRNSTGRGNADSSTFLPTYIQCPHQPSSSSMIEIQFLYSVETKGEDAREFLEILEWAMMKRLSEKLMHCISVEKDGQGVVRVDSSPEDSVLTKCQPTQSEARSCQQFIGYMKVYVIPYENAETATTAMVRTLIESDCKNDYYITEVDISPDLVKVHYVGDGDTPFEISDIASNSQGQSGPERATILAASLAPVAFLGLLAAALFGARKRVVSTGFRTTHEDGQKSFILSMSDPSLSEASSEWDHGRERLYGVFGNTYSTHNVHTCKSATCQLCYNQKTSLQFIRAPQINCRANMLTSIIEEEDDSSVL